MTTPPMTPDAWTIGDRYEPYIGRWSRLVAREFVKWLDVKADARWADVGPAPGYAMSLDEKARTALRERLRETLGGSGTIHLIARAWAVRGTRQPA